MGSTCAPTATIPKQTTSQIYPTAPAEAKIGIPRQLNEEGADHGCEERKNITQGCNGRLENTSVADGVQGREARSWKCPCPDWQSQGIEQRRCNSSLEDAQVTKCLEGSKVSGGEHSHAAARSKVTPHALVRTNNLCLVDLDTGDVRKYMVDEILRDLDSGDLYQGKFLSEMGADVYPQLLIEAATTGTAETLAVELGRAQNFRRTYVQQRKNGPVEVAVPRTAATTLAEGEFNRFYIRGLASEAAVMSVADLTVYRAKEVTRPRWESEQLIGAQVAAADMLLDLRISKEVTFHGVPAGPNSGLSLMLPRSRIVQPEGSAS